MFLCRVSRSYSILCSQFLQMLNEYVYEYFTNLLTMLSEANTRSIMRIRLNSSFLLVSPHYNALYDVSHLFWMFFFSRRRALVRCREPRCLLARNLPFYKRPD